MMAIAFIEIVACGCTYSRVADITGQHVAPKLEDPTEDSRTDLLEHLVDVGVAVAKRVSSSLSSNLNPERRTKSPARGKAGKCSQLGGWRSALGARRSSRRANKTDRARLLLFLVLFLALSSYGNRLDTLQRSPQLVQLTEKLGFVAPSSARVLQQTHLLGLALSLLSSSFTTSYSDSELHRLVVAVNGLFRRHCRTHACEGRPSQDYAICSPAVTAP